MGRSAVTTAVLTVGLLLASAAQASAAIRIDVIRYNPPGADNGSAASLRGEYITLVNNGTGKVNIGGWTISDATGHEYEIPDGFTLAAQKRVAIHTGSGTQSAHHLYWGLSHYIWDNGGDVARLRKPPNGALVDGCTYTGGASLAHC